MIIFGNDGERFRAEWTLDRGTGYDCTGCGRTIAQDAPAIEPIQAFTGFCLCNEDCLDEHNETEEAAYETRRQKREVPRVGRVSRSQIRPTGVAAEGPQTTTPAVRPALVGAGQSKLIGARIRELRHMRGWTQAQLAEKLGTHRPLVSRAEIGEMYHTLPLLCRYALAFGVSIYEILRVIDPLPDERECA